MVEVTEVQNWPQKLLIPNPYGFCAGVRRAIYALQQLQQSRKPGETIYAYHKIIHNTHVVRDFEEGGIKFVDDINEIPLGGRAMASAHGIHPQIRAIALERGINLTDATCPLVKKPHDEAVRYKELGYDVLYICHEGHDEAVGVLGEAPKIMHPIQTREDALKVAVPTPERVALITQTTLSQDETAEIIAILRERFPNMEEPKKEDICYATQNRQDGVKAVIAHGAEALVAVGSPNSSNSQRLKEVAESLGALAFLVDDVSELNPEPFFGISCVGLTAGASAPDQKFNEVVEWFKARGSSEIEHIVVANEDLTRFAPVRGIR